MPANFDLTITENPSVRQVVLYLLDQVETLSATVQALPTENQALRDENNPLKGEQGQPKSLINKKQANTLSEQERRTSTARPAKHMRPYQSIDYTKLLYLE